MREKESEICSYGSGDFWCREERKKRECEKVEFMKR